MSFSENVARKSADQPVCSDCRQFSRPVSKFCNAKDGVAVQECIAAIRRLDQRLMKDAYDSTLGLLSRITEQGSVGQAQYMTWHYMITEAIADLDAAGLSGALDEHLVHLATTYDYQGLSQRQEARLD